MANGETIDERVERLSKEMGGSVTSTRDPNEVEQSLDQNWDYAFATGPERVRMRKQAFNDAGLEPPTAISSPGRKEPNEEGPVHRYVRPALEAAGTVLGGIFGTPVAPPYGTMAGGALGFAGGDALASLAERVAGERPPINSVAQVGRETVDALGRGSLVEAGGRVTGKIIGKVLAPFNKQYEGENRALDEIAKERGITLDPHEILQNRPLALGHKVLENVPFTSGMVQRSEIQKLGALTKEWQSLREQSGAPDRKRLGELGLKIQDQIDQHLDKIGVRQEAIRSKMRDEVLQASGSPLTYKELGEASQKAIQDRYDGLKAVENAAWDYARESVPETGRVANKTLKSVAQEIKKEYENFPSFLDEPLLKQLTDVSRSGNPKYDAALKELNESTLTGFPAAIRDQIIKEEMQKTGLQPGWDVGSLLKLRSALSDSIQAHHTGLQRGDAAKGSADQYGRIYTRLIKAVDEDLQSFADATGSDVSERFKLARAASGQRLSLYNPKDNPWVVKSITREAAVLDKSLILPGNAAGYTALKETVGDAAARPVKQAFTNRLLGVGAAEEEGLAGLRTKLNQYGKQTLEEVYSPQEVQHLYDLADKANWMKKSPVGNPFFREMVKTAPAHVAPAILESPETTLKVLRTFPTMKQPLRQSFLESLHPNENTPFPTRLIQNLNAYPAAVQRQLFSQEELRDFHQLAKIIDRTKGTVKLAENPSGTAQNLVTFTTAGALLKHPLANAPQAMTTAAIAKLYLSRTGRKLLTEGLLLPSNSERAVHIASQIGSIAGLDRTNIPQKEQP